MGGNATNGKPIPGELSLEMYNNVSGELKSIFKLSDTDISSLGSTGKKPKGKFCGDIDIAINEISISEYFNINVDHVSEFMIGLLENKFENIQDLKGIGIISFLYPIPNSNDMGQVDLMLVNNIEMAKFIYHSPDFTKNESKYNGKYRNLLLYDIIGNISINILNYFDDGSIREYSKYSLTSKKGLFRQIKTFESLTGKKLKNSRPIIGKDTIICTEPDKIISIIFNKKYSVADIDTFEKLYKILKKSNLRINYILMDFKTSLLKNKLPLPDELLNTKTICQV